MSAMKEKEARISSGDGEDEKRRGEMDSKFVIFQQNVQPSLNAHKADYASSWFMQYDGIIVSHPH